MSYEQDAKDARKTLEKDGGLCSVKVYKKKSDDGNETVRQHRITKKVPGAMFDFQRGERNREGTEIKKGDKQFLMANDVNLQEDDEVEIFFAGAWWKVLEIGVLNPDGKTVIMYDLHLRK